MTSLWEKSLSLLLSGQVERALSPYLPELQLCVEGFGNGNDPAKVSVIDGESAGKRNGVEQNMSVPAWNLFFLDEKGVCVWGGVSVK